MTKVNVLNNGGTVEFATDEPRHYDRVPSIIDHLTYIDNEKDPKTGETVYIRKRLTPTEKELYRILRYRAGNGACWRNTQDLADHVGCSKNTVVEAKRVLAMPFEQLEGDPLIDIREIRIRTMRNGKCINTRPSHSITIRNIWRYNNAYMDAVSEANRKWRAQEDLNEVRVADGHDRIEEVEPVLFPKRKEVISSAEAELAFELMSQDGPVKTVHNSGAHYKNDTSRKAHPKSDTSPPRNTSQNWDVNKDTSINRANCLKTDPAANAAARCSLESESVEEDLSCQSSALQWLVRFGYGDRVARKLLREHSPDHLLLAALYVRDKVRKKNLDSITGYFIKALENRWYLKKTA